MPKTTTSELIDYINYSRQIRSEYLMPAAIILQQKMSYPMHDHISRVFDKERQEEEAQKKFTSSSVSSSSFFNTSSSHEKRGPSPSLDENEQRKRIRDGSEQKIEISESSSSVALSSGGTTDSPHSRRSHITTIDSITQGRVERESEQPQVSISTENTATSRITTDNQAAPVIVPVIGPSQPNENDKSDDETSKSLSETEYSIPKSRR